LDREGGEHAHLVVDFHPAHVLALFLASVLTRLRRDVADEDVAAGLEVECGLPRLTGGNSSISPTISMPSPSSSTAPSWVVGRASGARSVLMTTNSWGWSGPVFSTLKVTGPEATEFWAGMTAHS
jgi:hypothetical protein